MDASPRAVVVVVPPPVWDRSFRRMASNHLGLLLLPFVGVSATAVVALVAVYLVKMFGVSVGYHRYFSHRSFRTSRGFQLVLGLLGATSGQRGPLWWASRHRHHHRHSDEAEDVHSPVAHPVWWAHIGWLLTDDYLEWDRREIPDLARYPELVALDRWYMVLPMLHLIGSVGLGAALPDTSVGQMLVWGFFLPSVIQCHATMAINSVGHLWGTRPYATRDASRNNPLLALATLGDGWHNNHHRFPSSARHGLTWWQFDPTYRLLRILAFLGLVWDLKEPRDEPLME